MFYVVNYIESSIWKESKSSDGYMSCRRKECFF